MRTLIQRTITGLFFTGITIGGIYASPYTFMALFALVCVLCLREYLGIVLVKEAPQHSLRLVMGFVLGLAPLAISWWSVWPAEKPARLDIAETALIVLIMVAFAIEMFSRAERPIEAVAALALGMVYIGAPFALLNMIAFQGGEYHPHLIFGLLLLTWMNDTAAYVFGSLWGKRKLFPRISPKKTWEGTLGGVFSTLLFSWALAYWFPEWSAVDWLVLAAIVALFGSLGDLVESMLKRSYQKKDSSGLLPGHGGLLDRFDSFIFMLPFAAAYLYWLT